MDYQVTRAEIKKLSRAFRVTASQLLRTESQDGINNLRRFIKFIESNPLLYDFIIKNQVKEYDIPSLINGFSSTCNRYIIPDSKEDEISHTYQLLKFGLENFSDYFYFPVSIGGYNGSKLQTKVDDFNKTVVSSFVNQIEGYLNDLLIDLGDDDQSTIHIQIGKLYGGIMSQDNSTTQNNDFHKATFSGGIAGRDYTGDVIHNNAAKQNLAEAAAEIQQILQQLEPSYPTDTTAEKMKLAAEVIERVESNFTLKQRAIAAFKKGGTKAFEKAINHPVASFLVGAIEGWQKGE